MLYMAESLNYAWYINPYEAIMRTTCKSAVNRTHPNILPIFDRRKGFAKNAQGILHNRNYNYDILL